jgi:DNA invertase Pin-like site-specific DNA recombinase
MVSLENQALRRDILEGFLARAFGTIKMGLYARVSTHDQQTLALQRDALVAYAQQRRGAIVTVVEDVGAGGQERRQRETLMRAARRRELDAIVVWRLDRWGRSLADLVSTLHELHELGVGFISLSEALDFTTPTGRAMAGMLAVFAEFERGILRERVKAGIAEARRRGTRHGRPPTVAHQGEAVRQLAADGLSKSAIGRQLGIGRTSVRRLLDAAAVRRSSGPG